MHGLNIPDWSEYTIDGLETYRFVESGPEIFKDYYRVEAMAYINDHPDSFLVRPLLKSESFFEILVHAHQGHTRGHS